MTVEPPNELEERRVIRLLAGAAESVPPLHDVEIATLVRLARSPSRQRRRAFLAPVAAAAVAAAVLASVLPLGDRAPRTRSTSSTAGAAAHGPTFPAGSALSLLLARPAEEHA